MKRFVKNILICTVILFAFAAVSVTFVFPVKYDGVIERESDRYAIDPSLVRAVIWTESKFDERAISPAGAVGLMQLMPSTAYYLAELMGKKIEYADLFKADVSVELGVFYLKLLIDKFGDVKTALCAYNAGEGNVERWLNAGEGIPYKETRDYVKRVSAAKKIYDLRIKIRDISMVNNSLVIGF